LLQLRSAFLASGLNARCRLARASVSRPGRDGDAARTGPSFFPERFKGAEERKTARSWLRRGEFSGCGSRCWVLRYRNRVESQRGSLRARILRTAGCFRDTSRAISRHTYERKIRRGYFF